MKRLLCFSLIFILCLNLWACKLLPIFPEEPSASQETESTLAPSTDATAGTMPTEATEEVPPQKPAKPNETATEPTEAEPELHWKDAYSLQLSNLTPTDPVFHGEYSVYDLDGDGSPELFVKIGSCEADYMYSVYTMSPAGAKLIATLGGSHSYLCGLSGQNACLLASGHQGYECILELKLIDGMLIQEVIYEAYGEEYHNLSGLPTYELSKREGLNWTSNPYDDNQTVLDNHSVRFPYYLQVPFADQSVFSGPSYDDSFVQTVEFAGTYTIVEEQYDWEGNLWGRLKSGAGWINLTDLQYRIDNYAPISVNYADRPLLESGNYHYTALDGAEYGFSVAFRAYESLREVRIYVANLAMGNPWEQEVYSQQELTPDMPLVVDLSFPGDMSAYTITFIDENGLYWVFILTSSGRNNALVFYEFG